MANEFKRKVLQMWTGKYSQQSYRPPRHIMTEPIVVSYPALVDEDRVPTAANEAILGVAGLGGRSDYPTLDAPSSPSTLAHTQPPTGAPDPHMNPDPRGAYYEDILLG